MWISGQHLFKITAKFFNPVSGHFYDYNKASWSSYNIGQTRCESCYSIDSNGVVSFSLALLPPGNTPNFCQVFSIICESFDGRFKFSLLDRTGRPVPARSQASSLQNWSNRRRWDWACDNFITKDDLERPELLDDDHCFTVKCNVAMRPSAAAEERAQAPVAVAAVQPSDLHRHLGTLLAEKDGADVTFQMVAGGEMFAAHRCVLAARSPVFRAQLFGHMKESKQCTADGAPIPIDDMDAQVFGALLAFAYTDSLPEIEEEEDGDDVDGAVARYQHLLAAADRYGLDRMKLMCQEKLCEHMRASSVASMLALAERHDCRELKEACFDFLSSSANLESFTETDGFDRLIGTCPALLKELLAKLATVLIFE